MAVSGSEVSQVAGCRLATDDRGCISDKPSSRRSALSRPPSSPEPLPVPPRRHPLEIGAAQTHRSRRGTPPRQRQTRL